MTWKLAAKAATEAEEKLGRAGWMAVMEKEKKAVAAAAAEKEAAAGGLGYLGQALDRR